MNCPLVRFPAGFAAGVGLGILFSLHCCFIVCDFDKYIFLDKFLRLCTDKAERQKRVLHCSVKLPKASVLRQNVDTHRDSAFQFRAVLISLSSE